MCWPRRRRLDVRELVGPVEGRVRLVRLSDAIHASGDFEAAVEQTVRAVPGPRPCNPSVPG